MPKNISHLHQESLPIHALEILKKLDGVIPKGVLGGGSAISLQLGHRKSFDLDIFLEKPISHLLFQKIRKQFPGTQTLINNEDELTCAVGKTRVSIVSYPFPALHKPFKTTLFPLFDLRDLASSKAYTIGRRGAWRDYVDVFMLLKTGLALKSIIQEAVKRFEGGFNEKLFLEQLTYFDDIKDFTIEWLVEKHTSAEVKNFLENQVATYLK